MKTSSSPMTWWGKEAHTYTWKAFAVPTGLGRQLSISPRTGVSAEYSM